MPVTQQQDKTRSPYDDDAKAYEQARGFRAQVLELKTHLDNCDITSEETKITPPNWVAPFSSIYPHFILAL